MVNVAWHPSGKYLACSSFGRFVSVFDISSFMIVKHFRVGPGAMFPLSWSPDGHFFCGVYGLWACRVRL